MSGVVVVFLAMAAASDAHARSSYCSPSGDWCSSTGRNGDARTLSLSTFSFRGAYRLCVKAPDRTQKCRRFKLRRADQGIWSSTVTWRRHFPVRGRGTYGVRWYLGRASRQLGPTLTFRR